MSFGLSLPQKWTKWPPVPSGVGPPPVKFSSAQFFDHLNSWYFLIQAWQATREKFRATNTQDFPQTSHPWEIGTVAGITDNMDGTYTLTDGSDPLKNWSLPVTGGYTTGMLWAGAVGSELPFRPTQFDVIISFDEDDPSQQVRAQISANTTGTPGTLTITDFSDYFTAHCVPGYAGAAGKRYTIVKRNGLWWGDKDINLGRWLDYPNGFEADTGSVFSATTTGATLDSSATRKIAKDALTGKTPPNRPKDFLCTVDGKLRRATIASNDYDQKTGKLSISFTGAMPVVPAGSYTIVDKDDLAWPGRVPPRPVFTDYTGARDDFYCHDPDDVLRKHAIINTTVIRYGESETGVTFDDPHACDEENKGPGGNASFADLWKIFNDMCDPGTADTPYQPYIFKCFPMLQVVQDGLIPFFVAPVDHPQPDWNPKQTMTLPMAYYLARVNAGKSSVIDKDGSGHYHANLGTNAYDGLSVFFTVVKGAAHRANAGMVRKDDSGTVTSGILDLGTDLYNTADEPSFKSDVGATVFFTAGRTRVAPKMVRSIYERAAFIPDVDTDGDTGEETALPPVVVDFVDTGCFGPGIWVKRQPDTKQLVFDINGAPQDGDDLQSGDICMDMGENWTYPVDAPRTQDNDAGQMPPELPYYDRLGEMTHPTETQKALLADAKGIISQGTARTLTDTAKDWFANWYGGGVLRTESGTATSGSSTTLVDSTKTSGEANCFWKPERFQDFDFAWQGFILEVDKTVSSATKTYKTPITGCDSGTCTLTFEAVTGLTVSAGDVYRIREPKYNLNRYRGKYITVTRDSGTTLRVKIDYNDDETIWATFGEALQPGWTYQIEEFYPGVALHRNGSEWNAPTGNDFRSGEKIPIPFKKNLNGNAADWVIGYGTMRKFDYWPVTIFDEFRRISDVLRLVKMNPGWYHGPDYDSGGTLLDDAERFNAPGGWSGGEWDAEQHVFPVNDTEYANYSIDPMTGTTYTGWGSPLTIVGDTSSRGAGGTVDNIPPHNTSTISAHVTYEGSDPSVGRWNVQGNWNGNSAVTAYAQGQITYNLFTGDLNGVEGKIYCYAEKPAATGVSAPNTSGTTFDGYGSFVEGWQLSDTTQSATIAYDGFNDPEPGRLKSKKLGSLEENLVTVNIGGTDHQYPALPPKPVPAFPTAPYSPPDGPSDIQGAGYKVTDYVWLIDWGKFMKFQGDYPVPA
jgi:hypothetical protein